MEKYLKVLDLMKSKGGRVEITDPDLAALLGKVLYRLPTYMSRIRTSAHLDVVGVREGRKVVAYELGALVIETPADEVEETPVAV